MAKLQWVKPLDPDNIPDKHKAVWDADKEEWTYVPHEIFPIAPDDPINNIVIPVFPSEPTNTTEPQ